MAFDWLLKGAAGFNWNVEDTGAAHVHIKASDVSLAADVEYISEYEEVSDVLAYAGKAVPGSATSAAVWQVKELTFTAGGDISVRLADGNANFDNIWDNRGSLPYS
jgi:hypothetical protein